MHGARGAHSRDELFLSLSDEAVGRLVERAVQLHGEELINDHIKSASQNAKNLTAIRTEALMDGVTAHSRRVLGRASRTRKAGWFKSVTWMEDVARDIIGPDVEKADAGFRNLVDAVFTWAVYAAE